jgi:hypothetical protein
MKRSNGEGGAEVETKKVRTISGRIFLSQGRDWLGDLNGCFNPKPCFIRRSIFLDADNDQSATQEVAGNR